jgi:hypothetical protein
MAEMQEHSRATNLIIAHHEKEVGSLRKSLARCAETLHENPGSIFGKSAATLAELVRSMLARVRLKRKHASIQLQRIMRGLLVRNTLRYQTAEATKMQAAWRGLPPKQKLAGLLQAIRLMQRIHRGRMVRKDICHQAVEATKIQAAWRVAPHRRKLVEMLRAIRPLQRIIRGGLTRKNLALQQCSASLIASTFRHHASNIHAQYGALYASNQELLREKKDLANAKQVLIDEQTRAGIVEARLQDTIVQLEQKRAANERMYESKLAFDAQEKVRVHLKVQAAAAERLAQERAMAAAKKARGIFIEGDLLRVPWMGGRGEARGGGAGYWACTACTFVNSTSASECGMCGSHRAVGGRRGGEARVGRARHAPS